MKQQRAHWRNERNRRIRAKIFGNMTPVIIPDTRTNTETTNSLTGIVQTRVVQEEDLKNSNN